MARLILKVTKSVCAMMLAVLSLTDASTVMSPMMAPGFSVTTCSDAQFIILAVAGVWACAQQHVGEGQQHTGSARVLGVRGCS